MSTHIWILVYTLFVVVVQIQGLYEALRRGHRRVITPNLRATASLVFAALFGLFFIRWFLFLIACILLPSAFTIIGACVLVLIRLWLFLIDAFDQEGYAKELSPVRNRFSTILALTETGFAIYFFVAYFLI